MLGSDIEYLASKRVRLHQIHVVQQYLNYLLESNQLLWMKIRRNLLAQ